MFSTSTEHFVALLCLCFFLSANAESTSASSIMSMSAKPSTPDAIIQKIPVARTLVTENSLNASTQQDSTISTDQVTPTLTDTNSTAISSTTKLSLLSTTEIPPSSNPTSSIQPGTTSLPTSTSSIIMSTSSQATGATPSDTSSKSSASSNSSSVGPSTSSKKPVTSSEVITMLSATPDIITTVTYVPKTTELPVDLDVKCPELSRVPDVDSLTQDEFITKLTDSCRYDRLVKPISSEPLDVFFQIDMTHVESYDHLQLKAHILVQLLYNDHRLDYSKISPSRGYILGEEPLRNRIWVPHIIVLNERQSSLMGLDGKDEFVQISPEGQVIYSYRMTTTFYCWMNLQKFPFDHQICDIKWVSWAYNASNLKMLWDHNRPFHVASNLHLTEFVVENTSCDQILVPPSFNRGGLAGNYSGVIFKMKLRREIGYYMMDYFLPSILLVCMSWVTFWLQADAAPPRVTLGTSTMLTFITLNGGLSKSLPKVSYIKASEIWFLGCASFIFFSLAEFAFVNVIWRRRKKVELKKQNSKHILKGALTPSLARKQLRKAESINNLYKTRSCSSLNDSNDEKSNMQMNYLTIHSFPSNLNVPKITTQSEDDLIGTDDSVTTIPIPDGPKPPPPPTWTTMTPQEVAIWIDNKSRIVFPVSFLIFNILYWSFVYAL